MTSLDYHKKTIGKKRNSNHVEKKSKKNLFSHPLVCCSLVDIYISPFFKVIINVEGN